jgi:hypothetical protein
MNYVIDFLWLVTMTSCGWETCSATTSRGAYQKEFYRTWDLPARVGNQGLSGAFTCRWLSDSRQSPDGREDEPSLFVCSSRSCVQL